MDELKVAVDADALAKRFVELAAPSEAPVFESIARESEKAIANRSADPLASGVGEAWAIGQFVTPAAIAVAGWICKDVIGKAVADTAVAKLKPIVERLVAKLFEPSHDIKQATVALGSNQQDIAALLFEVERIARDRGASSESTAQLSETIKKLLNPT